MAAPGRDGSGDVAMDPALWGHLQYNIDLSLIYAKLPLATFFRLRRVCKEWNRLASDRPFLEQACRSPIAEPFFVVTSGGAGARLLTSRGSSWNSEPLPRGQCEVSGLPRGQYEVSGLLFVDSGFQPMRVFDLHTRVFHSLPPLPAGMQGNETKRLCLHSALRLVQLPPLREHELGGFYDSRVLGMTVDTTLIPYRFRVVIADRVLGTRIFDSSHGAWTLKPSTFVYPGHPLRTVSCFLRREILFINVENHSGTWRAVLSYNFERDEWGCRAHMASLRRVWPFGNVGLWRERPFVLAVKNGLEVAAWEVNSSIAEPYTLFDTMPAGIAAWMMSGSWPRDLESTFCGEHVLVYNCPGEPWRSVLYNLERKSWDRIELPALPVSPWRVRRNRIGSNQLQNS